VPRTEEIRFDSPKNNKKEPSERQTHVHVTQNRVSFEYLTVQEALHENLLYTLHEWQPEKAPLQTQLVWPRQVAEPYGAAHHTVDKYEIQAEVKRKDEVFRVHFFQVF